MLPWPRTITLEASVVLPVPSMARWAPASLRLTVTLPLSVWLPPVVLALSRLRMPPLAMLIEPLIGAALTMRSREFGTVVMSRTPVKVTLSRKLLALLVIVKEPPLAVTMPLSLTPFWMTALPAPAMIWLPGLDRMFVDNCRIPPLMACSVPLLTKLLPPPLPGATISSLPEATSAEIRPLFVSTLLPTLLSAVPMLPWPRTVTVDASVVVPLPSMARRAPASLRLTVTLPLSVWLPPVVLALSRLRMPPLAMLIEPLIGAALTMRSREFGTVVMSRTPVKVTLSRKLLALFVIWSRPVPLVESVPPLIVMPLCTTVLPACAVISPVLATLAESTSVAPLMARRVPLLAMLLAPPPPGGTILSVPPETSAEIRPLLVSTLLPTTLMGVPMLPWPRTVMLAPSVVVPLPSIARRAPASLRLNVPVPPMLLAAPSELSRLTIPPLPMLTEPFSVIPLPMRSRAFAMVVASSSPLSVTWLRTLRPSLLTRTAPVPVVLMVPRLMA